MPLWCSATVLLLHVPTRTKYISIGNETARGGLCMSGITHFHMTGVFIGFWMVIYAVYKYQQHYKRSQRTKAKLDQILNALQEQVWMVYVMKERTHVLTFSTS